MSVCPLILPLVKFTQIDLITFPVGVSLNVLIYTISAGDWFLGRLSFKWLSSIFSVCLSRMSPSNTKTGR